MVSTEQDRRIEADRLYERYGRPLEAEHWGEFVAISRDGGVVLGPSVLDVMRRAKAELGRGNYVFKVGERAVGGWRSSSPRS